MRLIAIICVCCLPLAALAETHDSPDVQEDEQSLLQRGAEMFLDGLIEEMEPALEEMRALARQFGPGLRSFLEEMGPALSDMLDEIKDWSVYEPPEILENGDIIIRRKPDQTPPAPTEEFDI